jgi:FtsH-binding integral membrane protein
MAPTCKYYLAKTFAHLAGALGIAAASSQVPIAAYLPDTVGADIAVFVVTLLILFFGIAFLMNISSVSPFKYPVAIAMAAFFGQLMSSLIHRLDEKNILLDVLVMTTGVFAGMVALGIYDNQNLVGLGGYLMAGLVGLILASLVMILLRASKAVSGKQADIGSKVMSGLGVGLFALITAYDTQQIKERARRCSGVPDYVNESVSFFLDFINLFTNLSNLQR